jgi:hypothetical protein
LKDTCKRISFKYNTDSKEIFSITLYNIAIAINRGDKEIATPKGYLAQAAHNTLRKIHSTKKQNFYLEDMVFDAVDSSVKSFEHVDLLKNVDQNIRKRMGLVDTAVYELVILGNMKPETAAGVLNISHGNLRVRKCRIIDYAKSLVR